MIFALGVTVGIATQRGITFSGASPLVPGANLAATPAPATAVDTRLIDDALKRLREQFYGDMPSNDAISNGALRGAVNAFGDQYTQYVEPRIARMMEEDSRGAFEGIGATLRAIRNNGGVQIVRVFENSPAAKAGVLNGDIVVAVNGQRIGDLGTNEVAALVRGPRGTNVTLQLRRDGEAKPVELVITRDRIVIPVVTSKLIEKDGARIAYAQLNDFSGNSAQQLESAISAMLIEKPKGMVLDLRNNGGGLLDQATKIGDLFLKEGVFIIQRDYNGKEEKRNTTNSGIAQEIPLVVLVNTGSASASEVLAGAVQDAKRGILIGEQTFGKGSVQLPQTLANGGQLRITIQRWFTPANRGINGAGIAPDYVVVRTQEQERAQQDPQLDAALEYLITGKTPTP
jgi:carboxyl-terminal processing protease